jgi:hypothetical protein
LLYRRATAALEEVLGESSLRNAWVQGGYLIGIRLGLHEDGIACLRQLLTPGFAPLLRALWLGGDRSESRWRKLGLGLADLTGRERIRSLRIDGVVPSRRQEAVIEQLSGLHRVHCDYLSVPGIGTMELPSLRALTLVGNSHEAHRWFEAPQLDRLCLVLAHDTPMSVAHRIFMRRQSRMPNLRVVELAARAPTYPWIPHLGPELARALVDGSLLRGVQQLLVPERWWLQLVDLDPDPALELQVGREWPSHIVGRFRAPRAVEVDRNWDWDRVLTTG